MKVIEEICNKIECQISMAEEYAKCALTYKEERPTLAEAYYRITNEQMAHVNLLHSQVVSIIEEYKKAKGEPPESMKMLYNILHRKHISHAATVKGMLALYKES